MHMLMSFVRDGEITGAAIFSKRMLIASLPLTAFFITIPLAITADDAYLTVTNIVLVTCVMIISYCQVVIYNETRRHEKHIAAQQVSVETRQKFLKEKKIFKVTTIVLLTLLITYSPILVVRIFLRILS